GARAMRIGFVVNDLKTEEATYTTTRLAMTATRMGHETWTMGVGDFIYAPDGSIHAQARGVKNTSHESLTEFMGELRGEDGREERITVDDLDDLLLRNDPSEDAAERPWAQTSGIL